MPSFLPVCAVVVSLADIKLAVGAQDAQRGLPITQMNSIDIAVAAHHWQTIRILLIGWEGKTWTNHNFAANSIPLSLQVTKRGEEVMRLHRHVKVHWKYTSGCIHDKPSSSGSGSWNSSFDNSVCPLCPPWQTLTCAAVRLGLHLCNLTCLVAFLINISSLFFLTRPLHKLCRLKEWLKTVCKCQRMTIPNTS